MTSGLMSVAAWGGGVTGGRRALPAAFAASSIKPRSVAHMHTLLHQVLVGLDVLSQRRVVLCAGAPGAGRRRRLFVSGR